MYLFVEDVWPANECSQESGQQTSMARNQGQDIKQINAVVLQV
jgi:hypothetical protein